MIFGCITVPYKKDIIVPDTNYITSAIRKFMLHMLSPGSFQNTGLLIWAQQGLEHVKTRGSNWAKIGQARLKISLHSHYDDLMHPYRVIVE